MMTPRDTALTIAGALGILAGERLSLQVPGTTVPITGQSLAVALCGGLLGSRRGVAAVALYLGVTTARRPSVWRSPTAGYLAGFLAQASVVGTLRALHPSTGWATTLIQLQAGSATLLSSGVLGLRHHDKLALDEALRRGYVPFIAGDLLKNALAANILSKVTSQ